jgi:hypothetical protein
LVDSLRNHSTRVNSKFLQHAVKVISTQVEVAALIILFEKFADEEFILSSLGFLDKFES